MATIPLGNFDRPRVAAQPGTSRVDLSGTMDAARAMEGLGRTGMAVGERMMQGEQQRIAQEEQKRKALQRVEMAAAGTRYEVQVFEEQERFNQDIAAGRVDFRNVDHEWGNRIDRVQPPTLNLDSDEVMTAQYQAVIEQTRHRARVKIEGARLRAEQAHYEAAAVDTINNVVMVAGMPGGDVDQAIALSQAAEPLLRAAGYDEARAAALIRKAGQEIYANEAKGRIDAAGADADALNAVLHDLTAKDGRYTTTLEDPNQRLVLANGVRSRLQQLETRAEQDANKREEAAKRTVSDVWTQATSGVRPSATMLADWQAAVAGTPYEAEFTAAVGALQDVQTVLRRGPEEQAAYVQELRANLTAGGGTPEDLARIERIERVIESSNEQRQANPLLWLANMTGVEAEPLDVQAALVDGDATVIGVAIQQRMDAIGALRGEYGPSVEEAPLLPQEAAALSALLDKASARESAEVFGLLTKAVGNPGAYRAVMQQIAADSPVKAYAGMIFAEQRNITTGSTGSLWWKKPVTAAAGDVARTMLEGEAILNKSTAGKASDGHGKFPTPTPAQFRTVMAELTFDSVGLAGAFAGNPEAYEIAEQAVRAYYVGESAHAGDLSGEVDPARLRRAVRAVLGAPLSVNGGTVFAPWGMDEGDFRDRLEDRWTAIEGSIPEGLARDFDYYRLRQVGNARYRVVDAIAGSYLYGADGRPVELDVSAPPSEQGPARELPRPDFSGWRGGARGL